MTAIWIVAATAIGIVNTSVAVPERGLSQPAAACIAENAPKVEQAVESLPDAVTFLTGDVCAVPLADEQNARSQQTMREFKDKQAARCAAQKDQPETKTTVLDPCQMAELYDGYDVTGGDSYYVAAKTPEATAYAAKLLLDLRLARLNAKH